MGSLLDIQEKLQETSAAIARLEKAAASGNDSFSLALMRRSLAKRLADLEAEFLEATNEAGIDVCNYRMFKGKAAPRLGPISGALFDFQNLIYATYDSLKHGAKLRYSIPADVTKEASLGFGYSYPGSIGFTLTITNERLLLGESDLDAAVKTIFEMTKMRTTHDVQGYAKRHGASVVRQFYKWVRNHTQDEIGADIDWRRGHGVLDSVLIQPPDFVVLQSVIEMTSDDTVTTTVVVGELRGADIDTRTFHLKVDDQDIRGKLGEGVQLPEIVQLPRVYEATLTMLARVVYSKDQETKEYFLARLTELEK